MPSDPTLQPSTDLDDGFEADDSYENPVLEDLPEDDTDVSLACSEVTFNKMMALLNIQDDLNRAFVGQDWAVRASLHEAIDYQPPILDEAAELIRSIPEWKFWKNNPKIDLSNAKLEFIDILHFTLSEAMALSTLDDLGRPSKEPLARTMGFWFEGVFDGWDDPDLRRDCAYSYQDAKVTLNRFLQSVLSSGQPYSDAPANIDWESFWDIAFSLGMTGAEVYTTYISKVALNHFRIANGDKDGRYHRSWWNGLEDNFYLMEQVLVWNADTSTVLTLDTAKAWLQDQYAAFLASQPQS
jgi:hypothetical protein